MPIERRLALLGGLAAPALIHAARAQPAAAPATAQAPAWYRFKVGSALVTVVSDGQGFRANPARGFAVNATPEQLTQALNDALIPTSGFASPYTATVVQSGGRTVLFDTGTGGQLGPTAGVLPANLRAAGIDPARIDIVVITHFHADHISGLTNAQGVAQFGNGTRILVPATEWAWWMDEANTPRTPEMQRANFAMARSRMQPYGERIERIADNAEIIPGVRAVASYGHTPGHTSYHVADGNAQLFIMGDAANRPEVFLRHPDWHFVFDVDGPMATDSRKRLFGRAADERARVVGYHFPFPSNGYVTRAGDGFRYVPADWSNEV